MWATLMIPMTMKDFLGHFFGTPGSSGYFAINFEPVDTGRPYLVCRLPELFCFTWGNFSNGVKTFDEPNE